MSDFVLQEHGDGRFSLGGQVSFHTAETILRESARLFAAHDRIRIDLSAVERTDSAGLALLLEWISQASQSGKQIAFDEIPEKIHAIAETAEIDELLMRSHSASSLCLSAWFQQPPRRRSHKAPRLPNPPPSGRSRSLLQAQRPRPLRPARRCSPPSNACYATP